MDLTAGTCCLGLRERHVLAAVSGGADSVALLHALQEAAPSLRIRLSVAHLNHGLRGRESDRDAVFVRRLARDLGIRCVTTRCDVRRLARRKGVSLEMAGREARYAFLARTARQVRAHCIVTAHTADDQAETVVLKLIRGAGPRGLAGIPPESRIAGVRVVRPFLDVWRKDILAFLRARRLAWREDRSNADTVFQRNRVRHELLPWIERRLNPQAKQALVRAAEILRDEDAWMDALGTAILRRCVSSSDPASLNIGRLRRYPAAARRRVYRLWLAANRMPVEAIGFDVVARVESLASAAGAGETRMPGGFEVRRHGRVLTVRHGSRRVEPESAPVRLRVPGVTRLPALRLTVTATVGPGLRRQRHARIGRFPAYASLRLSRAQARRLTARTWKPGDRMSPLGMEGSKKLQDIFVDGKVPAETRGRVPILAAGPEIVWLPGYRVARGCEVLSPRDENLHLTIRPARRPARR